MPSQCLRSTVERWPPTKPPLCRKLPRTLRLRTFSNLQKLPEWDPAFASVDAPSQIEIGTEFDAVAAFYGRRIALRVTVTALTPGESLSLHAVGKRIDINYDLAVDATPTGSEIQISTVAELSGILRPLDGGLNAALESTEKRLAKALHKRLVLV